MAQSQAEQFAALRTFFAAISDPVRLRESSIARDLGGAVGCPLESPDFAPGVRLCLDAAIESLSPRARTIIMRCDLANEKNRAVAADLGIGERYFYRERRRASAALLGALQKPHAATEKVYESEPVDALVGAATALHNAGRSSEGAAILSSAYTSESAPRLRLGLALQLARFTAQHAGRDNAAHWIACGRADLAHILDSPDETRLAHCELDILEIRADIAASNYGRAAERAHSVKRRLEAVSTHGQYDRASAALAAVYLCLSEAEIIRGSFVDGLLLALEGQANVQRLALPIPALDIEARVAVAQARFFATCSLSRALADFGQAYTRAVGYGLGRDVAKIASSLALLNALRCKPDLSAAFSRTALMAGRRTLAGSDRIDMSYDLAAAALYRRDIPVARSIVADAKPHALGLAAHVLTMFESEIALMSGAPHEALTIARQASQGIARHNSVRLLGSIQRIEAEALAATGQRSAAANRISDALDCLSKAGHQISLCRAFALSAQVTGNRRHRTSARELRATLESI